MLQEIIMERAWGLRAVAFIGVGLALGCAPTVTITPLAGDHTYPPTPDSVDIPLYSAAKPECPYDEIAAITAEGNNSNDAVLAALRRKARSVGAQAIVAYRQSARSSTSGSVTTDIPVRSGTAIRFRAADCMK